MKTFKNTLVILAVILLTISCSSDSDANENNPVPQATNYFLKAKIDGVLYESSTALGVLAGRSGDRITITSASSDNRSFNIVLSHAPTNAVGTYTIPVPEGADYLLKMEHGDGTTAVFSAGACSGLSGTLRITSVSATVIEGTFSFTAKRSSGCAQEAKVITEGSFKSPFITE